MKRSFLAGFCFFFVAAACALAFLASCTRSPTARAGKNALKIASMAPACTQTILALGLGENLIAVDSWSDALDGVPAGSARFDMMKPDVERLAELEPDLVLVSAITQEGTSKDPFKPLSEAGVNVVYLPTAASLADIRTDVARIAALVGRIDEGKSLVKSMDGEIARIQAIASKIPEPERRTVIFEISAAPYIYSTGRGTYLDELLAAAGTKNALSGETGWISVSAETVVAADPDVILTNVSYIDDPVAEILARPGWDGMKAVRDRRVYRIDANSSSQPGPDVAKALGEIAKAVYPEYFK
jgi:iron complex transport system substrate-binding protein